jgi:hypothetical protein
MTPDREPPIVDPSLHDPLEAITAGGKILCSVIGTQVIAESSGRGPPADTAPFIKQSNRCPPRTSIFCKSQTRQSCSNHQIVCCFVIHRRFLSSPVNITITLSVPRLAVADTGTGGYTLYTSLLQQIRK